MGHRVHIEDYTGFSIRIGQFRTRMMRRSGPTSAGILPPATRVAPHGELVSLYSPRPAPPPSVRPREGLLQSSVHAAALELIRDCTCAARPAAISYEKGIELKPFWQSSLLHELFNVTGKEHPA